MSDVDALKAFNVPLDPTIETDLRTLVKTHQGIRYLAVNMQPAMTIVPHTSLENFGTIAENIDVYEKIATMYNLEILYFPEPPGKAYEELSR